MHSVTEDRGGRNRSGTIDEDDRDRSGRAKITSDYRNAAKFTEQRRASTFVEVRFQEHLRATSRVDGPAPMWKQSLSMPFRPPHDDFTPNNLMQVQDIVVFTLFDELVTEIPSAGET